MRLRDSSGTFRFLPTRSGRPRAPKTDVLRYDDQVLFAPHHHNSGTERHLQESRTLLRHFFLIRLVSCHTRSPRTRLFAFSACMERCDADFLNMAAETELVEAQRVHVNRIVEVSNVESFDFGFEGLLAFSNDGATLNLRSPPRRRSSLRKARVWPSPDVPVAESESTDRGANRRDSRRGNGLVRGVVGRPDHGGRHEGIEHDHRKN